MISFFKADVDIDIVLKMFCQNNMPIVFAAAKAGQTEAVCTLLDNGANLYCCDAVNVHCFFHVE
jgi:hypothetical protein